MRGLSIHIEIEEAATLTSSVDRENVIDTYDHIPGSAIRGAIAAKYITKNGIDSTFADRFLHGVRFRYALPASHGVRSSAIPLSWVSCKHEPGHGSIDRARAWLEHDLFGDRPWECDKPGCGAERETQSGWMSADDSIVDPEIGAYTRSANENGVAAEGLLFTTHQINRREEFIAEIWGRHPCETLELAGIGPGSTLRVGRSKTTNGWLRITDITDAVPKPIPADAEFVALVMRSPAILRDPWLRPSRKPVIDGYTVAPEGVWTAWTTIYGWNSAAKIPKTPDVALSSGSTVLLMRDGESATGSLSLEQAAREGIGLRRPEGFGEIDLFEVKVAVGGTVE